MSTVIIITPPPEAVAAVNAALKILPAGMDSPEARLMMFAIGLQESRFQHRRQIGGPARGFWQFEQGGGVAGVLRHPASKAHALAVCKLRNVDADAATVYRALEHDDVLAACFARLLLWTDPAPLPALHDVWGSWDYYLRTWRPGKPHKHTWPSMHESAYKLVCK
jgi:hypothetical protein